ncbi:UPF0489 family protein [Sutcliffiella sp. NC1]|uniref:UPF0489 family protein n=1 Tax=Sutcliffiella sp. NC1 TaxID=3004096 RepID=UPI0022DE051A|nr:UPF0489 family protein [Sutcliffiella sp. NC1]WBL15225.1 UPF0489 family protein [Sutcliffiella sp. NC1]
MKYDSEYRICFPEQRIFISRDHNWAFSAWEIGRLRNYIKPGATVVHIDSHLDYLDPEINIEEIESVKDAIIIGRKLGIAEFIIPAQKTGTVGNVYIISNDNVSINDTRVERAYTLNHYEHIYRRKWFDDTEGKSVILDLDLDFFNYNYQDMDCNPVLLPEPLLRQQLNHMKKYMWEWDMITVALSPEYCGGKVQSDYLFGLFLDVFGLDIKNASAW